MFDSWHGWLHGSVMWIVILTPVLRMASYLAKCSTVTILKFILIFEQGILHFSLALGPTNYTASSASCFTGISPMLHTH